jgi:hypothetical protein
MRKGQDYDYDKRNIYVIVCDAYIRNVMTSTSPRGTLGSVSSLLAATLYQGNPDRNHKLWNIVSTERYILHMQCCWNVATYKWKVHNGQIEIISFIVKFRS